MAEENKPLVSVSSRRTYTLEFKLGVLEWMKSHGSSVRGTARRFGIHRRMVQRWMEKESELNLAFVIDGAQRKKIHHQSGSKQPLFQELEGKLLSWLVSQRESGTMISDNKIKTQALIIAMNMGLDSFKASSGWMSSFKKRNKDFLCRDSANGSSTNCYPSVSIEEQNSPLKLSGEALLAHTNPNETIHLIFTDVSKCDQLKEHDDAFVYFDYQTPEHNYCKMDNVPTLQACTPEEWNVHQDIVLIDKDDEQVVLGYEETVGLEGDEDIKVVIEFPCRESSSSRSKERTIPDVSLLPLLDIDGVLTVGDRTYQPEFTISPELVLLGQYS